MTPEEKLLRAIFGEKASDVRDTSLRVPPGDAGTVVEVRVFNRHGIDKDERAMAIEREEIERLAKDRDDEQSILDRTVYARLKEMLFGKTATAGPKGYVKQGTKLNDADCFDAQPRSRVVAVRRRRRQADAGEWKLSTRSTKRAASLRRTAFHRPGRQAAAR